MDTFGKRLREARLRQGLTQAEIGRRVGVRQNTIAGYEAGERQPDLLTLTRMAEALNVSVDYLLGRPEAVREATSSYSATLDLETRRGRLLHRLAAPGLSIPERRGILDELAAVEERIAALGLAPPHRPEQGVSPETRSNPFSVVVPDDALTGVHVEKDDVVICSAGRTAQSGDLVAVRPRGGEAVTVRFLIREGDRWFLRAANPSYPDQPVDPASAQILGVALSIERKAPHLDR